jgi:hypothetical protein
MFWSSERAGPLDSHLLLQGHQPIGRLSLAADPIEQFLGGIGADCEQQVIAAKTPGELLHRTKLQLSQFGAS